MKKKRLVVARRLRVYLELNESRSMAELHLIPPDRRFEYRVAQEN